MDEMEDKEVMEIENSEVEIEESSEETVEEATAAADTLHPGKGSGGTESRAQMTATFVQLLNQLGKEDLSALFNRVQSQYGPNKAPGAVDNSAKNKATIVPKGKPVVNVKEDIEEMFGDEELSEEFKDKAEVVFEAAVTARMALETTRLEEEYEEKAAKLAEEFETRLEEETATMLESVTDKLDQYLDYVTEQWMEANELAIEQGIRTEIAENFIAGLHNLFAEHYITVPDEEVDLVAELKAERDALKEELNVVLDEKLQLESVIESATKESVFEDVSEGLVETQVEKLRALTEGVEADDVETYRKKLTIIKENYFRPKSKPASSTGMITEEIDGQIEEDETPAYMSPGMDKYVAAISKSVK